MPLERMDELFEINPAYKAHGVMLERLKEVDHEHFAVRNEKLSDEERTEMA